MYLRFDLDSMWRATITKTYPDGRSYTTHVGPYKTRGSVTAAVNRDTTGIAGTGDPTVTVNYQRANLHWEDVETR